MFQKLNNPHENEVLEYIKMKGGVEAVMEHDDLVQGLVEKSGETLEKLADKSLTTKKSKVDSVREKLKKELSEDLGAAMERNFAHFNRRLENQSRNIDALEKHIIHALSAGTHDKIKDMVSPL